MHALDTTLYSLLSGDATLVADATGGIHNSAAREGTAPPYVTFQMLDGRDDYTFTRRGSIDFVYLIKCVGVPSSAKSANKRAKDMLARVEALLHDTASLSVSGYNVGKVRRERQFDLPPETVGGIVHFTACAQYRIVLIATS